MISMNCTVDFLSHCIKAMWEISLLTPRYYIIFASWYPYYSLKYFKFDKNHFFNNTIPEVDILTRNIVICSKENCFSAFLCGRKLNDVGPPWFYESLWKDILSSTSLFELPFFHNPHLVPFHFNSPNYVLSSC